VDARHQAGHDEGMQAHVIIAAARDASGSCQRASPQRGGWRAEKRKPMVSASDCRMRRAPLGAPHALK
jgi:hypothetical protein